MKIFLVLVIASTVWGKDSYGDYDGNDFPKVQIFGTTVEIEDVMEVLKFFERDLCANSMEYFFDGFVLDIDSFEKLQKLSPKCRRLPCDLTKHLAEYFAESFEILAASEDFNVLMSNLHEALKPIYNEYFCPCGVELFGWLIDSSRFYDGNVLYSALDETAILFVKRFLRYVDSGSLKRFLTKTTGYLCAETRKGVCIDDILDSMKYAAKNIDNTIDIVQYGEYEDLSYSEKEEVKQQCNNYLDVLETYSNFEYVRDIAEGMQVSADVLNKV